MTRLDLEEDIVGFLLTHLAEIDSTSLIKMLYTEALRAQAEEDYWKSRCLEADGLNGHLQTVEVALKKRVEELIETIRRNANELPSYVSQSHHCDYRVKLMAIIQRSKQALSGAGGENV